MTNNIDKPLCDHCGQTLEHFLNQMEEHNLEVVCPSCGKTLIGGSQTGPVDKSQAHQHTPNQSAKRDGSSGSLPTNSPGQKKH